MTSSKAADSIRIALVSTTCAAREGLRVLLERDPAIVVDCQSDGGPESLASLSDKLPDAVLVDGSSRQCLSALAQIRARLLVTPLLVYGLELVAENLLPCARDGATLIASQDAGVDALIAMVKSAVSGDLGGQARITAALLAELGSLTHPNLDASPILTRREREIAIALAEGLTNKEIAARFCVALPTVKSHVHSILRKLGIGRRDEIRARLRELTSV